MYIYAYKYIYRTMRDNPDGTSACQTLRGVVCPYLCIYICIYIYIYIYICICIYIFYIDIYTYTYIYIYTYMNM